MEKGELLLPWKAGQIRGLTRARSPIGQAILFTFNGLATVGPPLSLKGYWNISVS